MNMSNGLTDLGFYLIILFASFIGYTVGYLAGKGFL